MTKIKRVKWFANGAAVRTHNKEVVVCTSTSTPGAVILNFKSFDLENANTPAALHQCHRGKVRETSLKLSDEAMQIIVAVYMQQKRREIELTEKNKGNGENKN